MESGLDSIIVEEFKRVEILITSQNPKMAWQNLFLKGDVVLNHDRLIFKGLYKMEYFNFYVKIYNFVSLSKSSEYLVLSIADLENFVNNHQVPNFFHF